MIDDKLYIVFVLVLIGLFIYWYQKKLDNRICKKCIKRKNRKHKSKKKKSILKTVRFKDNDTDISLESLDSSDHLGNVSNDDDSRSCDTIDI